MKDNPSLRILSLGAGVQSSTLAMLIEKGIVPKVDAAIFADVGAEPKEVMKWLDWLKTKISYPLYVVQDRNLKEDLKLMSEGKYKKIPIPVFTLGDDGKKGMNRRACTSDYKIKPVTQKIRSLLGLAKGERRKKGTKVELLMGISTDEVSRMKTNQIKYITNVYPLIDLGWNRKKCIEWFKKEFDKTPPRSACTFCPFHSNDEWRRVKNNKEEWDKVVKLEKTFTDNKKIISEITGMKDTMYLTRKCIPIDEVDFEEDKKDQLDMFENECEGYCGI